jgi:GcrA cell cycle regulator
MTHPNAPDSFWTDDKTDALRSLWDAKRLSASEIGRELGTSRSAVLGRVHRLKLARRTSTRSPTRRTNRPSRAKAAIKAREAKAAAKLAAAQAAKPPAVIPPKAKPVQPTKNELRAMLAQAVRNTAAMGVSG